MNRLIDANTRRAQLYVNDALNRLDDATLTRLGHSPADIRTRQRRALPLI
jgi:hypothetical protein